MFCVRLCTDLATEAALKRYQQIVLLSCVALLILPLLLASVVMAQPGTPLPGLAATGTADQQTLEAILQPTVAAIFAQQTATAEAFPIADESLDSLAFLAFALTFVSMLVAVLGLVALIWWRGRRPY